MAEIKAYIDKQLILSDIASDMLSMTGWSDTCLTKYCTRNKDSDELVPIDLKLDSDSYVCYFGDEDVTAVAPKLAAQISAQWGSVAAFKEEFAARTIQRIGSRKNYGTGRLRSSELTTVRHEGQRERIHRSNRFLDIGEGYQLSALGDVQQWFAANAGPRSLIAGSREGVLRTVIRRAVPTDLRSRSRHNGN